MFSQSQISSTNMAFYTLPRSMRWYFLYSQKKKKKEKKPMRKFYCFDVYFLLCIIVIQFLFI